MLLNRTTAEQVALFLLEMDVRLSKTWRDRFQCADGILQIIRDEGLSRSRGHLPPSTGPCHVRPRTPQPLRLWRRAFPPKLAMNGTTACPVLLKLRLVFDRGLNNLRATRVPAIYQTPVSARDGGLLSYGADFQDMFRRSARYVDNILRGAKPSELPVQMPVKYLLIINLKTAKALGLTVPQSILLVADEVIEVSVATSAHGAGRTNRAGLLMSVYRGRPEVTAPRSK